MGLVPVKTDLAEKMEDFLILRSKPKKKVIRIFETTFFDTITYTEILTLAGIYTAEK